MRNQRVTKQPKDHWKPTTITTIMITKDHWKPTTITTIMITVIITTTVTTTITTGKSDKRMGFYIDTSDIITYNNEYN